MLFDNDGNEWDRLEKKLKRITKKMRENPPKDYDAVWNTLQEELTDKETMLLNKHVNEKMGGQPGYSDNPSRDVEWESVEYVIEEYDIVTQEELDDAHGERDSQEEVDYRDEERNAGESQYDDDGEDLHFRPHDIIEEIEEEEYSIKVEDTNAGCAAAKQCVFDIRKQMSLFVDYNKVDLKNPQLISINMCLMRIEGYLNGMHNCD